MKIPYRINQIRTVQFVIFPEKYDNKNDINVHTNVSFAVKNDLSDVRCIMEVSYAQADELLLKTQVQCNFGIAPEGINEIKKDKKIPVEYLRYIATIVTGTIRGIIHDKTAGTVLNGIILPPINLLELIKDDYPINTH